MLTKYTHVLGSHPKWFLLHIFFCTHSIGSMQKCEHKVKGKRFSVLSKESFLFFS